jgi:hypothetical protein
MKNSKLLLILVFIAVFAAVVGYNLITQKQARVTGTFDEIVKAPPLVVGDSGPIEEPIPAPFVVISSPVENPVPESGLKGMYLQVADLSELTEGDRVAIYIPQEDSDLSGYVGETSLTESGNKIITGRLLDKGFEYRFVFTVGRLQTFGTLHTPKGRYQLEARDGIARLVSAREIDRDLDFSKPDYIVTKKSAPEIVTSNRVAPE